MSKEESQVDYEQMFNSFLAFINEAKKDIAVPTNIVVTCNPCDCFPILQKVKGDLFDLPSDSCDT